MNKANSSCIQSAGLLKALYTLPLGRPDNSGNNLNISGTHSSHAAITLEDNSITFPPMSIVRYLFILLRELRCRGQNENAQTLKR